MTEEPLEGQEVPIIIDEDEFETPETLKKGKKGNNKTLWIILIILAVLVVLCCCAAVVLLIVGLATGWIWDQLVELFSSISPLLMMVS